MEPSNPNPYPDDARLMLAVGGLLFIPLSVAAVYGLNFNMPAPQGPVEWGIRVFLDELAVTASSSSVWDSGGASRETPH